MEIDFLKWIGHASFLINIQGKNIYIDPFRLSTVKDHADAILITHPHFDHMSIDDIKEIADPKTEIFVPKDSVDKVKYGKVRGLEPYKTYEFQGIKFSTIPSYNNVSEKLKFHPRQNNWVGYIINVNGTKIYHAGDTDFIEEMKELDVDIALLPMGGTYTMDIDQAINAANAIKAKKVIPMHYKALLGEIGSQKAEDEFKKKVKNSVILKEIQKPYYSFS